MVSLQQACNKSAIELQQGIGQEHILEIAQNLIASVVARDHCGVLLGGRAAHLGDRRC